MSNPTTEAKPDGAEATKLALEIEKLQQEVAALKRPPPTFRQKLLDQWQGTAITVLLGAFAAFPSFVVNKVKGGIEQVEQRSAKFEKISGELSAYLAAVEDVVDYHQNGITGKEALGRLSKDYNAAIDDVRRYGHANRALVARLWGAQAAVQYQELMAEARQVDALVHRFNVEDEKVVEGQAPRADPQALAPVVAQLGPAGKKLADDVAAFLKTLE